jgi:hypothetical protein
MACSSASSETATTWSRTSEPESAALRALAQTPAQSVMQSASSMDISHFLSS